MKKKIIIIVSIIVGLLLIAGITLFVLYKVYTRPVEEVDDRSPEEIRIAEFAEKIYETIPSEAYKNFKFTYEIEGFEDLTVTYESKDKEFLSNKGIIFRTENDRLVKVEYTIKYLDLTKVYNKDVKVMGIKSGDAFSYIYNVINSELDEISSDSKLPTSIKYFESAELIWNTSVIKQETSEVTSDIIIEYIDDIPYIKFVVADSEYPCLISVKIKYYGITRSLNVLVFTKTK